MRFRRRFDGQNEKSPRSFCDSTAWKTYIFRSISSPSHICIIENNAEKLGQQLKIVETEIFHQRLKLSIKVRFNTNWIAHTWSVYLPKQSIDSNRRLCSLHVCIFPQTLVWVSDFCKFFPTFTNRNSYIQRKTPLCECKYFDRMVPVLSGSSLSPSPASARVSPKTFY